jgi:predicted alpha/beta-fold hydrolase
LQERGWRLALPHFRGCSGELNRQPRAYHSGDSQEIDWILRRLHAANGHRKLHAAGVSLGGNALLKWTGEQASSAAELVTGIAALCAPLDLAACGHHLAQGFNRIYTQHFLNSLKAVSAKRLRQFPGLFDESRMRRAINLYQFDDAVTAPLHGFDGADDYWRRASAMPWLKSIAVPTLTVNPKMIHFSHPAISRPVPTSASACVSNTRRTAAMWVLSQVTFREIWTGYPKDSYTSFFTKRHKCEQFEPKRSGAQILQQYPGIISPLPTATLTTG